MSTDANKPKSAPGQTEFFEIKDRAIVDRVLELCYKQKTKLTIWVKSFPKFKFDVEVADFHLGGGVFYFTNPKSVDGEDYVELLKKAGSSEILGNFLFDKNHFFFKANFVEKTPLNILKVDTPGSLFKLQRRKDLRIYLPRASATKLFLIPPGSRETADTIEATLVQENVTNDQLVKRGVLAVHRLLDLSIGGLSFAATVEQKSLYKADIPLNGMRCRLQDKDYILSGVIRHIREMSNDQGKPMIKVGVQFGELRPSVQRNLVEWVLEQSRDLFAFMDEKKSK